MENVKYYTLEISELYVSYEAEINPQPTTNHYLWKHI